MHGRKRESAADAAAAKAADAPRIEAYRSLIAAINTLVWTRPTRCAAWLSARTAVDEPDTPAKRATPVARLPPTTAVGRGDHGRGPRSHRQGHWTEPGPVQHVELPPRDLGEEAARSVCWPMPHSRRLVALTVAAWSRLSPMAAVVQVHGGEAGAVGRRVEVHCAGHPAAPQVVLGVAPPCLGFGPPPCARLGSRARAVQPHAGPRQAQLYGDALTDSPEQLCPIANRCPFASR